MDSPSSGNVADAPLALAIGLELLNLPRRGLKLLNLTKRITDLLMITKLLTVFDTYDSEQEALNSFQ